MTILNILLQVFLFIFPWKIRRILLCNIYNYDIHPTAGIGFSILLPKKLKMEKDSRIHNFVICKKIDKLHMSVDSGIATMTFITGFGTDNSQHFKHIANRNCELVMGKSSGITSRHFIDCNGGVYIGDYTTVAGIRSQILTHSIDVYNNRQHASSVVIGKYCFIGTSAIILPGATVPDYSVIAAGSVVTKGLKESRMLYAGNPAVAKKPIIFDELSYFCRKKHKVS